MMTVLTLIHFTPRSNLVTYAFVWEKMEIVNFSKTIVPCELKVGICNQLNEEKKLQCYQRSSLLTDLGPRSLDIRIKTFFFFFFNSKAN